MSFSCAGKQRARQRGEREGKREGARETLSTGATSGSEGRRPRRGERLRDPVATAGEVGDDRMVLLPGPWDFIFFLFESCSYIISVIDLNTAVI